MAIRTKNLLRLLVIAGVLVLVAFGWWALTIPSTPNVASQAPEANISDPVRGGSDAKVSIIAFSDFQCTYCKEWAETSKQLLAKYGDGLKIVWKDFPLTSVHTEARPAAIAARCAQQQFKFWEYHDALFADQSGLGNAKYPEIAKGLELDETAFTTCLNQSATADLVDQGSREAAQYGVSSTPTLFIGRYVLTEVPSFREIDSLISSLRTD